MVTRNTRGPAPAIESATIAAESLEAAGVAGALEVPDAPCGSWAHAGSSAGMHASNVSAMATAASSARSAPTRLRGGRTYDALRMAAAHRSGCGIRNRRVQQSAAGVQ